MGFIFQAQQFFDSLCHDEFEKPIVFELKTADQLAVKILKVDAGFPVA